VIMPVALGNVYLAFIPSCIIVILMTIGSSHWTSRITKACLLVWYITGVCSVIALSIRFFQINFLCYVSLIFAHTIMTITTFVFYRLNMKEQESRVF
jgi:hypothetical protein